MWLDLSLVAGPGHASNPDSSVPTAYSGLGDMQSRNLQFTLIKHRAATSGSVAASKHLALSPLPACCLIASAGLLSALQLFLAMTAGCCSVCDRAVGCLLSWDRGRLDCCSSGTGAAALLPSEHPLCSLTRPAGPFSSCNSAAKGWDLIQVLQTVSTLKGGTLACALGQAARMLISAAYVTPCLVRSCARVCNQAARMLTSAAYVTPCLIRSCARVCNQAARQLSQAGHIYHPWPYLGFPLQAPLHAVPRRDQPPVTQNAQLCCSHQPVWPGY